MAASTLPDANASWQDARAVQSGAGPTSAAGWLPDGPGGAGGGIGMVPTQFGPRFDSGLAAPTPVLRGRTMEPGGGRFGYGAVASAPTPAPWSPKVDGVAVAGFVCSLLLWPVGLVLSVVGMRRTKAPTVRGRGLAVAALVLSLLGGAASGLAAFTLGPVYLDQYRAAQQAQVSTALGQTSAWVQDMRARHGGYPLALDSTAPSTDPVRVRLVPDPNGGAPCLDASLGGTTMTATPRSGYRPTDGACS